MTVNAIISLFSSGLQFLKKSRKATKTVALIVAHPDDETLWAGGTILNHPSWKWFVVCLCRGSDEERAPRFQNALKILKTEGLMGDLDDGPEQQPLDENEIERVILGLLPPWHFDLLITHSPTGEYTRHIRHEETGRAVIKLWHSAKLSASELWTFAYEDGNKQYYPISIENAPVHEKLSKMTWLRKYRIITRTYGFEKSSFEAKTTPLSESFRQFKSSRDAYNWLTQFENLKV
jgi:LmbE family N-acetylglucosaminyl deacetylase